MPRCRHGSVSAVAGRGRWHRHDENPSPVGMRDPAICSAETFPRGHATSRIPHDVSLPVGPTAKPECMALPRIARPQPRGELRRIRAAFRRSREDGCLQRCPAAFADFSIRLPEEWPGTAPVASDPPVQGVTATGRRRAPDRRLAERQTRLCVPGSAARRTYPPAGGARPLDRAGYSAWAWASCRRYSAVDPNKSAVTVLTRRAIVSAAGAG